MSETEIPEVKVDEEKVPTLPVEASLPDPSTFTKYTIEKYRGEEDLADIIALINIELSEPYSIYTYRYFLTQWPHLCFMVHDEGKMIGIIIGKIEGTEYTYYRGYIAMLAVHPDYRKAGLGTALSVRCINEMKLNNCYEVYLETQDFNEQSLRLYQRLGFIKTEMLPSYYLNHTNAFRLSLSLS